MGSRSTARTPRHGRTRALRVAAVVLLNSGLCCVALYALAEADQNIVSTAAVNAFHEARERALAETPAGQESWSPSRRAAYDDARRVATGIPEGLLHVPALDLLVPIFNGTGELVLNRGIGWIEGTAAPGGDGNVGLAGHRDGFFRGLKNLRVGDALEIQTVGGLQRYRVTEISVVEPVDVHVLAPTEEPSVTLVTCYPFFFVGRAPQRFIVRGVIDDSPEQARAADSAFIGSIDQNRSARK